MVMMTLYVRQQKRHRDKEQSSGLCVRGMGWGGSWEGVFRMGNTGTPVADSCHCMVKTTTIL